MKIFALNNKNPLLIIYAAFVPSILILKLYDSQQVTSKIDDNDKSLAILVVYASKYYVKRKVL